MDRKALKLNAKKAIKGKIGILLAIFLIVAIASGALSFLTGGIATILIVGSISISMSMIYLDIVNKNKSPIVEDIFRGFKDNNFGRGILGYIRYVVFIYLWTLLFIIPGIIKGFSYSQMFYLMADNKKLEAGEAQKKSMEMMKGHKAELFVLQLSFIPWMLLVCITFGLAAIYVGPYMEATMANYYNYLKKLK